MIITRFAPSPTGSMHVGNARTALFNYLYAKKMNGKFLLRIEDTDKERSTKENINTIFRSLEKMYLTHDGDVVMQSDNINRHIEVANDMLARDLAYRAYDTKEELDTARKLASNNQKGYVYNGVWKNADHPPYPDNAEYVVRIRNPFPIGTFVTMPDLVQGDVTVDIGLMDDFIILRSDGTPTYLLSVVVDDHDAKVNTIIRGDDHLTNTFRQYLIYHNMGWMLPDYAHLPLIHDAGGRKLSKRTGAMSIDDLDEMGIDIRYGLVNYLATLSWSINDGEYATLDEMANVFNIRDCNKGAARFDMSKLISMNAHWIRAMPEEDFLYGLISWNSRFGTFDIENETLEKIAPSLRVRSKTYKEAMEMIAFLDKDTVAKSLEDCKKDIDYAIVKSVMNDVLFHNSDFMTAVTKTSEESRLSKSKVAGHIRLALTGQKVSPPMHDVIAVLDREVVTKRCNLS